MIETTSPSGKAAQTSVPSGVTAMGAELDETRALSTPRTVSVSVSRETGTPRLTRAMPSGPIQPISIRSLSSSTNGSFVQSRTPPSSMATSTFFRPTSSWFSTKTSTQTKPSRRAARLVKAVSERRPVSPVTVMASSLGSSVSRSKLGCA